MLETLYNIFIYFTSDEWKWLIAFSISILYFSIISIFVNADESEQYHYKFGLLDYIFTLGCSLFWMITIPLSFIIMSICLFHFIINKLSVFIRRRLCDDIWN